MSTSSWSSIALVDGFLFVVLTGMMLSALVVVSWNLHRLFRHGSTAIAILALSVLVALIAQHVFSSWTQMLHDVASQLPPPLAALANSVRPIAGTGTLSPMDVLSVSLVFYTSYAVVVVFRRCVDTTRILKVSRRRMTQCAAAN